jgi:hypothetical protein
MRAHELIVRAATSTERISERPTPVTSPDRAVAQARVTVDAARGVLRDLHAADRLLEPYAGAQLIADARTQIAKADQRITEARHAVSSLAAGSPQRPGEGVQVPFDEARSSAGWAYPHVWTAAARLDTFIREAGD